MRRAWLAAVLVALFAAACSDDSDNDALTLDDSELEQALLSEEDLPAIEDSLTERGTEEPLNLRRCFELTYIPTAHALRSFTESPENGAGYTQLLLAYTRGDATDAFAELTDSYRECDDLPELDTGRPVGDESALFHVDSYFQAYIVVWRRQDVISVLSAVERPLGDAMLISRGAADRRLFNVLERHGAASNEPAPDPTEEQFEFAGFEEFDDYRLFWLGEEFEGLPLTDVVGTGQGDPVSFLYGDCYVPIGQEGGCSLPVQIQVWPACQRNYEMLPAHMQSAQDEVRGVPALRDPETGVDIYTGDVTIAVFADPKYLDNALSELRSVDGSIKSEEPLPPPVEGHLEGEAPCPRSE